MFRPRPFFILGLFLVTSAPAFAQLDAAQSFEPALQQARVLVSKGEWDASEILFLKTVEKSPSVEERIRAYQGLADLYKTLRLFGKARKAEAKLAAEKEFLKRLVPEEDSYYKEYEVQKGDTYQKISLKNGISEEWLRRANADEKLKAGDKIRLPKFGYDLTVDKASKRLIWKRGEEIIKIYPVSVGRVGTETPEGSFHIMNKVKNPIWYRMKQTYPPDSPANLLGTRWMGLDHKGYGIHGTRDPRSIGSAASHGCVRMFNRDVEEIFRWVPIGTSVTITSLSALGSASPSDKVQTKAVRPQ